MKSIILLLSLTLSAFAFADVSWTDYSEKALTTALDSGKKVVLGFHKQGCGTCHSQDAALEKTGITKKDSIVFLKVERKNENHSAIYEKYGFSQKQWAALIAIDKSGEVARVQPGNTNEKDIKTFSENALRGNK